MDRFFITGSFFVIIGGIAIAIGGIFTTLGWNNINKHSQVKSLITAIAQEWEINNTLINKDPLFVGTDEETLGSYRLYPRFKTSALNNALISGIFNPSDAKDRELLRAIADLQETILDVNMRLDVSDRFVTSTQDKAAIINHRRTVISSLGFHGLLLQQQRLRDTLIRNYKWAMPKNFLD